MRAPVEIGVGLGLRDDLDGPAGAELPPPAFPVHAQGGLPGAEDLLPFPAFEIGVEDETAFVERLEENHPNVGKAIRVHARESHGRRIVEFRLLRLAQPDRQGFVGIQRQPAFTEH